MNIQQLPNLLGANTHSYVNNRLNDPSIHWYYLPYTATTEDSMTYAGSLSHLIFKDDEPCSPLWEPALAVLLSALDRQGQKLAAVYRVRLGLITRTAKPVTHSPHVDLPFAHRTGIFYPKSSSGDTVVYNQTEATDTYTELARVTPADNLWFDFPGEHYHASTTPTLHDDRLVLTINYSIVE
jgi:hypothetical protein